MARSDYPDRPLIGVGVVVLKCEAVLLVRRGKPPRVGEWSLPGGRQRLGETVRETALREVREETGCKARIAALLDVVDSLTLDAAGAIQYHYTLVDFLAEWLAGEPAPGGDVLEAAWVPIQELPRYRLWSETVRLIEQAVREARAREAR